jgi:chromosome segregation ATPase
VSAEFEADWEGDNSAVPAELRSVVKELAGILIDMADEEVEELVSAYEKADLDGDLQKVAPTVGDDVMSNDLQKSMDDIKAELTKATTDLTAANESLAKVTGERDELTKAVKERDDMLIKAAAHIEQQAALIEKMKDQPDALKIALSSFGKGDDVNNKNEEDKDKVLKADGTVDEAATAIRKALRNPVVTR